MLLQIDAGLEQLQLANEQIVTLRELAQPTRTLAQSVSVPDATAEFGQLLQDVNALILQTRPEHSGGENSPSLLGAYFNQAFVLIAKDPSEARFPPYLPSHGEQYQATTSDPTRYVYIERGFPQSRTDFSGAPVSIFMNNGGSGYYILFELQSGDDLRHARFVTAERIQFDERGRPNMEEEGASRLLSEAEVAEALREVREHSTKLEQVVVSQ